MISEPDFYGCIRSVNDRKSQLINSVNKFKETFSSCFSTHAHPHLKEIFEVKHENQTNRLHIDSKVFGLSLEPLDKLSIHELRPIWKFSYFVNKDDKKINVLNFYLSYNGNVSLTPNGSDSIGFYDDAELFEDILIELFSNLIDKKIISASE